MRQGIALRGNSVELLYYVSYAKLRFNTSRASDVFYITPKYVPGLRGMLLVFDVSEYVVAGKHFEKNGVIYRLFFPLKGPL
ncbi:MAG TPA: hypothetical protein GX733_07290 [Tissierellia bacterium]|nr:hypothetical protein [Tissierellia bacterium]